MKIKYKQKGDVTLVEMCDSQLTGVSSCRPDDIFNPEIGLAVAIIKASKRVPQKEIHFLDDLKGAIWKTVIISEKVFGEMIQHMIGYRIACRENGVINDNPGLDVTTALMREADKSISAVRIRSGPPDCVVAERIGRDLLKYIDLRKKMRLT